MNRTCNLPAHSSQSDSWDLEFWPSSITTSPWTGSQYLCGCRARAFLAVNYS